MTTVEAGRRRRPGRPTDSPELRARILEAAAAAFARSGYEGARIEQIAQAAGCTRALVYFYFSGKPVLFEAVLDAAAEHRAGQMAAQPQTLADGLLYWFGRNMAEPQRIRLIMQETLAEAPGVVPARRVRYLEGQLAVVRAFQARGLLRADVDARHLLTMILALTSFPACFPGVAKVALGAADEAAMADEWTAALRRTAELLAPPA